MVSITRIQAKQYVGPGWASLVDSFYDKLESYPFSSTFYISQVKEKFGGLRIYFGHDCIIEHINDTEYDCTHEQAYKELQNFVDNLEKLSYSTCESCGNPGEARSNGWILTLCNSCHEVKHHA